MKLSLLVLSGKYSQWILFPHYLREANKIFQKIVTLKFSDQEMKGEGKESTGREFKKT